MEKEIGFIQSEETRGPSPVKGSDGYLLIGSIVIKNGKYACKGYSVVDTAETFDLSEQYIRDKDAVPWAVVFSEEAAGQLSAPQRTETFAYNGDIIVYILVYASETAPQQD